MASGLLYPTPVWHAALNEAAMAIIEERIPENASPRQVARALTGVKNKETLYQAQRRACDILTQSGLGSTPESLGEFHIDAVFPVDNAVPPR